MSGTKLPKCWKPVKNKRPKFSYELREVHEVLPTMTDINAPIVQTVSRAIKAVIGVDPTYVVSPGTYDQKHIDRIGRLKNCIAYGPGILDLAHKARRIYWRGRHG